MYLEHMNNKLYVFECPTARSNRKIDLRTVNYLLINKGRVTYYHNQKTNSPIHIFIHIFQSESSISTLFQILRS